MPSHSNAKDRATISPDSAESASIAGERAGVEWPRLLARIVEGIVSAELHQFEENVMAFLNSAAADAYASFVWLFARVIGACLLLTGLILFVGVFLEWWAVFALVGAIVIALSSLLGRKHTRLT
jgi:hypothetical protein